MTPQDAIQLLTSGLVVGVAVGLLAVFTRVRG